ncbi:MAG: cadmium-translocating P-type ATPase, partial [Paracoccaceae bacterium]|nr:cadmium-translocating P-type ATPase [Paracoccaceae bacterium]
MTDTAKADRHEWAVSGMDCASCAAKISTALERLPGVSEVQVSVMAERLTLLADPAQTPRDRIEATVRKLGYGLAPKGAAPAKRGFVLPADAAPAPMHPHDHAHPHPHDHAPVAKGASADQSHDTAPAARGSRWYQTGKGRLVIGTGALLVVAWAFKLLAPAGVAFDGFVLVSLVGVAPVGWRALNALRAGIPFTIEMLMTIAAVGALFIGAAEEAALVVFLFAVGEVLEGVAANRARASIRALGGLVPRTALLEEDGATRPVQAASLRVGQTVLVRPGDRIPADGEIVEGSSGIDESPVTGESMPRTKTVGEPVFAGSINTEAVLRVAVTRAAEDNTIARIIRLVEEAETARAPTERFIDRFSRLYMPAIVGIALLVGLIPPLAFAQPWGTWIYRALALLLIGCPCALVISVPASIASALSAGARRGILMKGGAVIEAAARTTRVAFDKTGTLTLGRPVVTDVLPMAVPEADLLGIAAGVEAGSSHPLAEAILRRAEEAGIAARAVTGAKAIVGNGVTAELEGRTVTVGSPRHAADKGALDAAGLARAAALEAVGKTVVAVFCEGETLGLIATRDEPRTDAVDAVRQLRALG